MLFNVDKCKTVHFGYKNKRNSYYLGSSVIKSDIEKKDLGVHESLKSTSQCVAAAKSANITLGMIRRTFIDNNCKTSAVLSVIGSAKIRILCAVM